MKAIIKFKGGAGSGHHGHQGRPGKHGGSSPGGGGGGSSKGSDEGKAAAASKPMPNNITEWSKRNPRTLISGKVQFDNRKVGTLNATGRKYVSWFAENGNSGQRTKANDILDMDHIGDGVSEDSVRDLQYLAKNS